jgi:hypothetical protein
MNALFWVTYGILWIVLATVVVMLVLLYRQFGLMIMPGGRRISYAGLDIGVRAPVLPLRFRDGTELAYDWILPPAGSMAQQGTIALFAMPGCPICDGLAHNADIAALPERYPTVRFVWIDGEKETETEHANFYAWSMAVSRHAHAHSAMDIPGTPFAYFISTDAHILAKSLVNALPDFEALIEDGRSKALNGGAISELPMPAARQMEET